MASKMLCALLVVSASAFVPAAPPARAARALTPMSAEYPPPGMIRSMPFLKQPPLLDGTMAGDAGFDPLGLSQIDDVGIDLYWLREAEVKHARVAMLAAAGVIFEELFGPAPGLEFAAANGRSQMDVFWDFWDRYPNVIFASLIFIGVIEVPSGIAATQGRLTGMRAPGDFSFNPLGFEVTQNLAHKEIANGRLAMIAVAGFIVQGLTTHESALKNLLG